MIKETGEVENGKAVEGVGIGSSVAVAEETHHKTIWTIDRYEESIYENKVKALNIKISECLVLSDYAWNRGDKKGWFTYSQEAKKLIEEQKAHGYNQTAITNNLLLNEGIDEMWLLIAGAGGAVYNNANARLGVGDSAVAAVATQTDLQAATNKLFVAMNAGFPTTGTQKITFKSDFTSGQGNYAWNEFSVDNGSTPLKNLNRKVSTQGTKTSGQTWTLTLDITLS